MLFKRREFFKNNVLDKILENKLLECLFLFSSDDTLFDSIIYQLALIDGSHEIY